MTIVTAIVSPSARPRPSIAAPAMPAPRVRQHGHPDHLPARRAEGERGLLGSRIGTVAMTSREIALTIGRIMIARISPATK